MTFCHAEELAKSFVVPKKRPTSVFKFGAEASIANDCAHKEKLKVLFKMVAMTTIHTFLRYAFEAFTTTGRFIIKQDLNFTQTYRLNLCSALGTVPYI